MSYKLLEGIRIVDVTVYVTGPVTTQALADCGAEVIKIDSGSKRSAGGMPRAAMMGSGYPNSTGKLSVTINFTSPRGLELAHNLIAKSDIVVENLAGGTLTRRGLGYEDLKKIKPDIIMLSTCMQGQTGPHAAHAASGHKLSALTGYNHLTGWPERQPAWVGTYTDFVAPRYNIIAIMAALDYRRRTGKGQFLDMSQYEAGVQFLAPLLLDNVVNKRVADRMGNKCDYAAPHNVYRCAGDERWCAIAVFTDEEWRNFCKVIDNPSLAEDPKLATLLARKENEEELDGLITEWTIKHTPKTVMMLMQEGGVAAGMVENVQDQMESEPHLKHRHFFWELEQPEERQEPPPLDPDYRLSLRIRQGPSLGENNDYVFKDILGMPDDKITELVNDGVIG
ncbi:CaiB/BaiF CoA transferase family protein [Chloroflexota bacterium]